MVKSKFESQPLQIFLGSTRLSTQQSLIKTKNSPQIWKGIFLAQMSMEKQISHSLRNVKARKR
jgi:hypothetical protein